MRRQATPWRRTRELSSPDPDEHLQGGLGRGAEPGLGGGIELRHFREFLQGHAPGLEREPKLGRRQVRAGIGPTGRNLADPTVDEGTALAFTVTNLRSLSLTPLR